MESRFDGGLTADGTLMSPHIFSGAGAALAAVKLLLLRMLAADARLMRKAKEQMNPIRAVHISSIVPMPDGAGSEAGHGQPATPERHMT